MTEEGIVFIDDKESTLDTGRSKLLFYLECGGSTPRTSEPCSLHGRTEDSRRTLGAREGNTAALIMLPGLFLLGLPFHLRDTGYGCCLTFYL